CAVRGLSELPRRSLERCRGVAGYHRPEVQSRNNVDLAPVLFSRAAQECADRPQEDSARGDSSPCASGTNLRAIVNDHELTGHRRAARWGLDGAAALVGHGPVTAVRGKEPSVAGATVTALLLLRLLDRAGLSLSGPTGLLLGSLDGPLHVLLNVDVHRVQ